VRVAGEPLRAGADGVGDALDLVRRHALDLVLRYARGTMRLRLSTGREMELRRADLGVTIDRARLAEFIAAAMAPEGAVHRAHVARDPSRPLDVPLPRAIEEKLAVSRLLGLKAVTDEPPVEARIDAEAR